MLPFLATLCRSLARRFHAGPRRRRLRVARLGLERLEGRDLPSAYSVQLADGGGPATLRVNDAGLLELRQGDTELFARPSAEVSTLAIQGTAGADQLALAFAGTTLNRPLRVEVGGGGGADEVTYDCPPGGQAAQLGPTGGEIRGPNLDVVFAQVPLIHVRADGTGSHGRLTGSANPDTFRAALGGPAALEGDGYALRLTGFDTVEAADGGGAGDVCLLDGSPGDDTATVESADSTLAAGGSGQRVTARGFEQLFLDAGQGGFDALTLHDTPGNDRASLDGGVIRLEATDGSLAVRASGFEQGRVFSRRGGRDRVALTDTPATDTVVIAPAYVFVRPAGARHDPIFFGFADVEVTSARGGLDTVWVYDKPGNDRFNLQDGLAVRKSADGTVATARGFRRVRLVSSRGGSDELTAATAVGGSALIFNPFGNSVLNNASRGLYWGFYRFKTAKVWGRGAGKPGADLAVLNDGPGTDLFYGPDQRAPVGTLTNASKQYTLNVYYFRTVILNGRARERNFLVRLPQFPLPYFFRSKNFQAIPAYYGGLLPGAANAHALIRSPHYLGPLTHAESLRQLRLLILKRYPALARVTDQRELALRLRDYVHQSVVNGANTSYWPRLDPYHRFLTAAVLHFERVRCAGVSLLYRDVLQAFGIRVRLVRMFAADGFNTHASVEAVVRGRWVALDATFNASFVTEQGVLLGYAEMAAGVKYAYTRNGYGCQPGLDIFTYPVPYAVYLYRITYEY